MPPRRFSDLVYASDDAALFTVNMSLLAKNSSRAVGPPRVLHLHPGEQPKTDNESSSLRRSERVRDQFDCGMSPPVYAELPTVYPLVEGVGKRVVEVINVQSNPPSAEEKAIW